MWTTLGMQMMEIHLQELLHPEATERLAREVSVPTHNRPYRQWRRWLSRLGQSLVGLGRRLQRVGLPPAAVPAGALRSEKGPRM